MPDPSAGTLPPVDRQQGADAWDGPAAPSHATYQHDHDVAATLAGTLESLDGAENYRGWILEFATPFLEGPILEVGAGHGTFSAELAGVAPVTAVEPDPYAAQQLVDRYADDPRVTVIADTVEHLSPEPHFRSAVMINVLEHIADDRRALDAIHRRLVPGGHLVLWVPAFQLLYADFDRKLGHERRYRRRPLVDLVTSAGYRVVDARYVNVPGWFSWLLLVRMLSMEPTSPKAIALFDRWFVPVVRSVERWINPPFGQSVLLVARRPLADETAP